jgi:ABC-type antimicrobial peptide transport system permease subunit
MSWFKVVLSSLRYYRGINLSVLAGVALTSATLSGSFVVGDSVKESLRRNAEARLSRLGLVMVGGERFVSASLADRVMESEGWDGVVAPILQIEATASNRASGQRANKVQILGVDERFWEMSTSGEVPEGFNQENWIGINQPLANRIDAEIDDTLILRIELPAALSRDAPLSGESEQTTPFTAKVSSVLNADQFGLFSLRAEQVPPSTLFVRMSRLESILEQPGRANILAVAVGSDAAAFADAVEASWNLEDLQLSVSQVEGDATEQLVSSRVFFDDAIVKSLQERASTVAPVLTYLATDIKSGDSSTPYSMVTGVAPNLNGIVEDSLPDDGIILSDWVAEDLGAAPGDKVTLVYNVVGTGRTLTEQEKSFVVNKISPIGEFGWDDSWTPAFPGIFDVDDLDDWEPGIPINRDKIRDKDDEYWDQYRATPKAFVSLSAAKEMWSNRFGSVTAVRFRETGSTAKLDDQLRQSLRLEDLGMAYRDLQAEAESAVANSFDFGALFASMSFFLVVSALVLAGLVFVFGIEQRSSQIGLMLALGFTKKKVRLQFLTEALILSLFGAALGLLGGYVYTRLALYGMSGVWEEAAAGIEFVYFLRPESLANAFGITVIVALTVVWLASRRVSAVHPSHLISGSDGVVMTQAGRSWDRICFVGSLLFGLGCLLAPKEAGTMSEQGLFFGAGFLFTTAGVSACSILIRRFLKPSSVISSINALGRQHAVRRRGRSLAVVGLMAAGVFMVTAINSFRLDGARGAERRTSGTGGFAFVGEATLPIYEDLNGDAGREKYGLDDLPVEFSVYPFRISEGEDASCLNLNRAQRPRLMATDESRLAELRPFSFTKEEEAENGEGWSLLSGAPEVNKEGILVIPGIVDQNTATYALQKGLGDLVIYETVSGQTFAVRIAGFLDTSILQGNLIISEKNFIHFFPDAGGYQFFLIDGEATKSLETVANHMSRMFGDLGLEMRPAAERLNEFNAVQNTYLSIFSTLGGLGIFLGTLGLAIVVGRNVLERRSQLGVMQAIGFTREMLAKMVLAEHWFLHAFGVLLGFVSALVAVYPQLLKGFDGLPIGLLLGINGSVLLGGLIFCWVAARFVLRAELLESIRRE